MYMVEPPFHAPDFNSPLFDAYNAAFNWTMTYRTDSDFFRP